MASLKPAALPTPAPSFDLTPHPPGQPGEWTESASYKLKVGAIKRCSLKEAPPEGVVLGVSVDIYAKYDNLLVASRDVTLESGGIILKSEIDPKVAPGCGSLLKTRPLRHDQTASGVVVFKVPPEFDTRSMSVVYEATRWGGSPRVEVKVPPALVPAPSSSG